MIFQLNLSIVSMNYSNVLNLVLLAIGVKESIRLHTIMTIINLLVVCFIIIAGAFKINFHNWNLSESEVGSGNGKGGFLPFGFSGMMAGKNYYYYCIIINRLYWKIHFLHSNSMRLILLFFDWQAPRPVSMVLSYDKSSNRVFQLNLF